MLGGARVAASMCSSRPLPTDPGRGNMFRRLTSRLPCLGSWWHPCFGRARPSEGSGIVVVVSGFSVAFSSVQHRRRRGPTSISSEDCDIFPIHLCHVLLCHHCICVHFRRALESQAKRRFHTYHHIGLHLLSAAHTPHIGSGAELLLLSLIHDHWLARIVQQHNALVCSKQ